MTKEQLLESTDAFLFDLDGTVYLDETPIGDVKGTLARLRALKKRVVFVTNNSSKTEEEYRKKLSRIGILGEGDLIYTSAMAAAEHVFAHFPKKPPSDNQTFPALRIVTFLLQKYIVSPPFLC